MNILITGGFGFIGSRLAQELATTEHKIRLSSRVKREKPEWIQEAEISQVEWNDEESLKKICKGIDCIIHAAGMNAKDCEVNPEEALYFNGLITLKLINSAINQGVKRFIYLSTAHVYSSRLSGEIDEGSQVQNLTPYSTSHYAGERSVLFMSSQKKIEGVVLRISNSFGVPSHGEVNCWNLLINDACRQVVKSNEIILNSSGFQQRNFIGMQSLCEIIIKIIDMKYELLQKGLFNIGSEENITISEVAKIIKERSKIILKQNPQILFKEKNQKIINEEKLNYKTKNWINELSGNKFIDEIDQLLMYCKKRFN
jgi:UDP-glucose 4-epimerase